MANRTARNPELEFLMVLVGVGGYAYQAPEGRMWRFSRAWGREKRGEKSRAFKVSVRDADPVFP